MLRVIYSILITFTYKFKLKLFPFSVLFVVLSAFWMRRKAAEISVERKADVDETENSTNGKGNRKATERIVS